MAQTETLTYLIKFVSDLRGAKMTEQETKKLEGAFKSLGLEGAKMANIISTRVNTALNKKGDLIQVVALKYRDLKGNIVTATGDINNFSKTVKLSSESTIGLTENLRRLIGRAALTIPVWLALRGAMVSVFGTISNGLQSFVDLDEALINAKNEILNLNDLDSFMERLRTQAKQLAAETGVSATKAVEAFRLFATAGIDAELALKGMSVAVKGSVATMGESGETATFLADVYNTMGNTITQVTSEADKFEFIMGSVAALMPTNTFTMKQFTDAFKNFGAAAKGANLTLDQTFFLIAGSATAMQRGARGGTQLASAFQQMGQKMKEVADFLGPGSTKGKTDFEIFIALLEKAADTLRNTGSLPQSIDTIFGRKGGLVVKSDAAQFEKFVAEYERFTKLSAEDRTAALVERFGEMSDKIKLQLDRMKELREQLVQTFIEGVTGADSFVEALKKVNKLLQDMTPLVRGVADAIHSLGKFVAGVNTPGNTRTGEELKRLLRGDEAAGGPTAGTSGAAADFIENFHLFTGALHGISASLELGEAQDELAKRDADLSILEQRLQNLKARQKAGLPTINLAPIEITKEHNEEKKKGLDIDEEFNLKLTDRLQLMDRLTASGLNDLQIEMKKLEVVREIGDDKEEMYRAELAVLKQINKEITNSAEKLRGAFEDGLTDLLAGDTTFEDFGDRISETVRRGFLEAMAGSFTDQIFQATGIGEIFGSQVFNFRHMGDGIGGPIKGAFDYGGKISHDSIVQAFLEGSQIMKNEGSTSAQSTLSQGGIKSIFAGGGIGGPGGLTLPGFGTGGIFNRPTGTVGGNLKITGVAGPGQGFAAAPLANNAAKAGPSLGNMLGGGLMAGLGIFSGLNQLKSAQDGLGKAAGGLQIAGSALMLTPFAPIGMAMQVLSPILGLFSKKKEKTVDERTQDIKLAPKIDVTNKKLDLVNRNLVALRSTMETFILPESAYFSEKRVTLEDNFSIDSRRG